MHPNKMEADLAKITQPENKPTDKYGEYHLELKLNSSATAAEIHSISASGGTIGAV
jgi:hypothetical protein